MKFAIKIPEFGVAVIGGSVDDLFKKKGDHIKAGEVLANLVFRTREGPFFNYALKVFHTGTIVELSISQGSAVSSRQVVGTLEEDE